MKKLLLLSLIFSISVFAQYTQFERAIFAGGHFWTVEDDFSKLYGVADVISGYVENTTNEIEEYEMITRRESVQVTYDPLVVSYQQLLNAYFRMIDPTDGEGSFTERGSLYTPAIYTSTTEQKQLAEEFILKIEESEYFTMPIVVEVISNPVFVQAEDQQQNFAKDNPVQYSFYRVQSGRDSYISKVWNKIPQEFLLTEKTAETFIVDMEMVERFAKFVKPDRGRLKERLSGVQFSVTQDKATEPPYYEGNYHDNKQRGIYVDIVSGEPLFSTRNQFDAKNGWPTFTKPISEDFIEENKDVSLFHKRRRVNSRYGESHLGYVSSEGHYIINGSSLRFIPVDSMRTEGYEDYISMT